MTEESRTSIVAQLTNEWHANILADVLRDQGINAEVSGALTSQFRAEAPGLVRVIVPEEQYKTAMAALVEHQKEASEIDWSQVDVGHPE